MNRNGIIVKLKKPVVVQFQSISFNNLKLFIYELKDSNKMLISRRINSKNK